MCGSGNQAFLVSLEEHITYAALLSRYSGGKYHFRYSSGKYTNLL